MKKIQFVLVFLILISCQEKSKDASIPQENIPDNPVFELISTSQTGINFENTIKNKENFNIFSYRNFYNGGGVGIGDINNDGLEDLYFTSPSKRKLAVKKPGQRVWLL